jgi:hypothetical protein
VPQTDAALLRDLQNAFPGIADLLTDMTEAQWHHLKVGLDDHDRRWAEMFPDMDGPDGPDVDKEIEIACSSLPHWLKLIRLEEFRAESRSTPVLRRQRSGLKLVENSDRTAKRGVTIPFPPQRETIPGPYAVGGKVTA